MYSLQALIAKMDAIEEGAKFSEIPASQRKEKYPHGWKVTQKDLEDEEKEGKVSHPDTLAKNTGRTDETSEPDVPEVGTDSPETTPTVPDPTVVECGDDEMGGDKTVQLSMHDLIALVNNLQKGQQGGDQDLFGAEVGEEYGNDAPGASGPFTTGIDAITQTGDDMHSKGDIKRPKVNGGENPMQEALIQNLQSLYARIKASK